MRERERERDEKGKEGGLGITKRVIGAVDGGVALLELTLVTTVLKIRSGRRERGGNWREGGKWLDGKKATERMVGGGGEERKEILQLRIVERGLVARDKDGGEPWTARREWERARKVPR